MKLVVIAMLVASMVLAGLWYLGAFADWAIIAAALLAVGGMSVFTNLRAARGYHEVQKGVAFDEKGRANFERLQKEDEWLAEISDRASFPRNKLRNRKFK